MAHTLTQLNHLLRVQDARLSLLEAKGPGHDVEIAKVQARRQEILDEIAEKTEPSAQRLPYADPD